MVQRQFAGGENRVEVKEVPGMCSSIQILDLKLEQHSCKAEPGFQITGTVT